MTRKHFKAVAEILSMTPIRDEMPVEHASLADEFADFFESQNLLFNRDIFLDACGVKPKLRRDAS
jgi:hypothetical protein